MALEKAGIYGNQGIQDLLLGLEWVQDNIAQFGGDPVFEPLGFQWRRNVELTMIFQIG
jgi:hypothetical protein